MSMNRFNTPGYKRFLRLLSLLIYSLGSLRKCAEVVAIDPANLSRILHGKYLPSAGLMYALLDYVGVSAGVEGLLSDGLAKHAQRNCGFPNACERCLSKSRCYGK